MDISVRIGGQAGQGIQSIGELLLKTFSSMGFFVFSHQDYMSRIRGGHNFFQLRVSDRPVHSSRQRIDLLLALDRNTLEIHQKDLNTHGMGLYDRDQILWPDEKRYLGIPMGSISKKIGGAVFANTVATGAMLGMLGIGLENFEAVLEDFFLKKGALVVQRNIAAAREGYEAARAGCLSCAFGLTIPSSPKMGLLNGNEAIAIGAVLSGLRFYSAYPMTPSTGILNHLSSLSHGFGIMVEQAEDEISAINMAIGASFGGVRAMTGSSGGGFALMVEGLSLAAMTETPIVIAEVQRPGPATGLPTRTEQGDLLFVLFSAHGEFPRVVFAPGSPEQALILTNKAFDMAERFQIPAIVMSDQYLADSTWSVSELPIQGLIYHDHRLKEADRGYKRHLFTDLGISPLAVPGLVEGLVVTDSDEHDEEGHIIESGDIRKRMVEKRLFKKLPQIRAQIKGPDYYGPRSPEVVLLGWGSLLGVLLDTMELVNQKRPCGVLHFSEIWPFPSPQNLGNLELLRAAKETIGIENNAQGQFAYILRAETGLYPKRMILKYDGRPFYSDTLAEEILGHISHL